MAVEENWLEEAVHHPWAVGACWLLEEDRPSRVAVVAEGLAEVEASLVDDRVLLSVLLAL